MKNQVKTYYGVNTYPDELNSYGVRWYCSNPSYNGPAYLRAGILSRIKQLIREAMGMLC